MKWNVLLESDFWVTTVKVLHVRVSFFGGVFTYMTFFTFLKKKC